MTEWKHPGGKLRELGAASLNEQELLAILISTGIKGRSAEQIAAETLQQFGSLQALAKRPLEEFLKIKGLSAVKSIRIAAAFELARRL
jgi:DNA repair protein RadC